MALPTLRALDRVHLHYGVQAFAEGLSGIFVLAYLLKAGVPLAAAIAVLAFILAGRFAMRPAVLPVAKRWGLRRALIFGTLVTAASFILLPAVQGVGWSLAAYCAVSALGSVFYWTCFHAYFAVVGAAEDRGHQVGVREALATSLGVIAPAIGGWSLGFLGPGWTFILAGGLHALAALPLLHAPDVDVAVTAPDSFGAARRAALIYIADGPLASGFYLWQIVLFLTLCQTYAAYGAVISAAALIGAVAGVVLGRSIDAGKGRSAVKISYAAAAVLTLTRAFGDHSTGLAIAATALGAISAALLVPIMMTPVYNLAKTAPCPLRFSMMTEGAWDMSCGAAFLLAAALVALGAPLALTLLMGLPSAAAVAWLLDRYYQDHLVETG